MRTIPPPRWLADVHLLDERGRRYSDIRQDTRNEPISRFPPLASFHKSPLFQVYVSRSYGQRSMLTRSPLVVTWVVLTAFSLISYIYMLTYYISNLQEELRSHVVSTCGCSGCSNRFLMHLIRIDLCIKRYSKTLSPIAKWAPVQ